MLGKLEFLLSDPAVELIELVVGGAEIEFLLGEFFAGRDDVRVVLRDAAVELGFALVVESDACLSGGEGVLVFVEFLADLGEFVTRKGIYPPLPDANKIELVDMIDMDKEAFTQKMAEYRKIFLQQ